MKDKVVIITGASSGIGRALAWEFAKHGSKLVIAARKLTELQALEAQLKVNYHNLECYSCPTDVSIKTDCERLISFTVSKFGPIDVLINNAGISMRAPFEQLDVDVLEKIMNVNFWGAVYCTKFALPSLLESKGIVVGVSSIAGYRGLPERTGYSASKFALQGFLESLRTELLPTGVGVVLVAPGFTASNIRKTALNAQGQPHGESIRQESAMMSAEAVAKAIYRAVIKRKRTLVLTRQGKLTVWLNKFFPAWMDKQVFRHFELEKKGQY